jgi:glycosyltransferase involved in cell wall biosynthesis
VTEKLPSISIVMTTRNAASTLERCLESVAAQDYPKELVEIVLVDDHSTDSTPQIARRYGAKVTTGGGGYCEIGRLDALRAASNELVMFLDGDNILQGADFLRRCVRPFAEVPDLVGSFPARYAYFREDPPAERYSELFGINDPFEYYLASRCRLMATEAEWTLGGRPERREGYTLLDFAPDDDVMVLGAIAFVSRRAEMLELAQPPFFFHADATNALIRRGRGKFAALDAPVIHVHSSTVGEFLGKCRTKIRHYFRHRRTRGRIWATKKPWRLIWAAFVQATVVGPLTRSLIQFAKLRDPAWLLHPYISWRVVAIYSWEFIKSRLCRGKPAEKSAPGGRSRAGSA